MICTIYTINECSIEKGRGTYQSKVPDWNIESFSNMAYKGKRQRLSEEGNPGVSNVHEFGHQIWRAKGITRSKFL